MNWKYVVKWVVAWSVLWFPGDTAPPGTPIYMTRTGQQYYRQEKPVVMITESRDFAFSFYAETIDKSSYYTFEPFAIRQVEIDSFRTVDILKQILITLK